MASKKNQSKKKNNKKGSKQKDQKKSWWRNENAEERPEKKPLVIKYDADGNRIGDDGYVMTKVRTRMHRILDGYFVYAIIIAVIAIALIVLSCFQGAQYGDWELYQRGGNQFNGWDMATLLRVESVFMLFSAVMAATISFIGFRWFYDNNDERRFKLLVYVFMAIAVVYFLVAVVLVLTPEPCALVDIAFGLLTLYAMREVKFERPKLKKAKVAKTITKK